MRSRNPNKQGGVAALVVTMTLFFAMLLVAVFANRNLVFEQRGSANSTVRPRPSKPPRPGSNGRRPS